MDLNSILNSGPVFALIGVLLTVVFNYLIQRSKGSADLQIADRKTLSEDQENFKKSILQELGDCRDAVDKLTKDNTTWQEKALAAQEQKLALTSEIILLNQRILETDRTILELQKDLSNLRKDGVNK